MTEEETENKEGKEEEKITSVWDFALFVSANLYQNKYLWDRIHFFFSSM